MLLLYRSLLVLLFVPVGLLAQNTEKNLPSKERPIWFLSAQPIVFAEPSGGFKAGGEMVLGQRVGLGIDLAARYNNFIEQDLQDGEENRRMGYQVQPEIKWYLHKGNQARRRGFRPLGSALSLRTGYTRYETRFRTWTSLVDGSGNSYQKLLQHTRNQKNYDLSLLLSGKFYFHKQGEGLGFELFAGFGVRFKKFTYTDFSPELSADQLRQADENRRFTLLRDGSYPIFPAGARLFYRFSR